MATNISIPTYGFVNHILALNEGNWRRFFKPFITDSVQSGLATIAGANMTVYVSAGECRCGAVMGILDEMIALDIANGDSTYDRIDSVIVQYTYGEPSTLAVAIVQGTPSANPVPPTLTKVYDTLWQMEIAQILVPSGATSSSEFTITDKRVIYESIESIIDDNTESEERVWSSQKSREEIVSLSTEIYDSLNTKADVIERTVSGDIVTITDGADNIPVKELVVDIEPVQDLHGYDNPWPAGGGKNIWNPAFPSNLSTICGMTFTHTDDVFTLSGTCSGLYQTVTLDSIVPLTNGEAYTLSIVVSGTCPKINVNIRGFDSENTSVFSVTRAWNGSAYSGTNTATVSGDIASMKVTIQSLTSGESYNCTVKVQLEKGSTATSYTPYSNICPITGHTSAVVTRTGKNLLEYRSALVPGYSETINDVTFTVNSDYSIKAVGTATTNANFELCYPSNGVRSLQGKTVYIWDKGGSSDTKCIFALYNQYYGGVLYANGGNPQTIETQVRAVLHIGTGQTVNYTFYPMVTFSAPDNTFELYRPFQTVTIALGETRYGATLNVLTGMMTVTDGYIASYNGETLPSTWISDRDAYAEGTIPTIGAQVVYKLASPQTVQLSPSKIQTLLGENSLFATTGDILSLTYRADMKTYVDEQVAEANLKTRQMMTTVTTKMVAPSNLVVGDIVIVNDDLYKVINSNIASGEAMVVGTNVEKITLTEYIQSLI